MLSVVYGSWMLINLKSLVKRQTTWVKITHDRSISIDDITEEESVEIKETA